MGIAQIFSCDVCEKFITKPEEGLVYYGDILKADPKLVENTSKGIDPTVHVFCKACFLKEHFPEINVSQPRTPQVQQPGMVDVRAANAQGYFTPDGFQYHNGDGILFDGFKYKVMVNVQDGTEDCGSYETEQEAAEQWVDAQKVLNGNNVTVSQVKLFTGR